MYSGNERFPRQPSPVPEVPASRDQPFGPVQHPEILRGRNQLRREPAELDRDPASDDRHYFFEEKSGLRLHWVRGFRRCTLVRWNFAEEQPKNFLSVK